MLEQGKLLYKDWAKDTHRLTLPNILSGRIE
jgi:hypothetical protein